MHILGYNIDIYDEFLNEKLNNRNDVYNFMLYVEGLKEIFNITFKEGLNIRRIARVVAEETNNTYDDFLKQMNV